jgi:ribosomal protein L37AE/L43A
VSSGAAYVELRCPACKAPEQLRADATELTCPACGAHHRFLLCPACHETAQVDDKVGRRGGIWRCPSCRSAVPVPRLGRPALGSADAVHRQLEAKGTLKHDPDNRVHGGFIVVGVKGAYELPARVVCTVATLADEVRVVVAGPGAIVKIPYERLTGVQIVGEDKTSGRFFKDRFGVAGATGDIAMGMLTNQNRKKREIRTVLHIASQDGELLLFHGRMPPDAMRQSFPRLVSRFPQE